MRTRRAIWITLLCAALVGALFVLPGYRARAESITVTFEGGSYAYTNLDSGVVAADPARSGESLKCANLNGLCRIRIDLPGISHVTHVQMDSYKSASPPYNLGRGIWLYDASDNLLSITFGNSGTWDLDIEQYSSFNWITPYADVDVSNVAYAIVTLSTDGGYDVYMDNVQIVYSAQNPTVTPTPTGTLPPIGVPYPACALLGDNALIGNGWDVSQASRPEGQSNGAIIPAGKSITLPNVQINPTHQYQMLVYWQANIQPDPYSYFNVWLGEHEQFNDFAAAMPEDTAEHSYLFPPVNFYADAAGQFNLTLSVPELSTDPQTQINYICIEDRSAGSGGTRGSTDSTAPTGVCAACIYEPVGDLFRDIPALLGWLWCGLRRLVECDILGILSGIWNGIAGILRAAASFIAWVIQVAVGIYDFFTGSGMNLTRWGAGYLNNIGTTIGNSAGPWGDQTVNGINGLATNLPIALGNEIASISGYITSVFNTGEGLLGMIGGLLTLTLHAIGFLVFIVPILIASLVSGFMAAAAGIPPSVVSCTVSGSTFYPICMGFYILDNTIFSGPAFYLLPLVEGALAWDTVTWALHKFREAFSR